MLEIIGQIITLILIWALLFSAFILIEMFDLHLPTRKRKEKDSLVFQRVLLKNGLSIELTLNIFIVTV